MSPTEVAPRLELPAPVQTGRTGTTAPSLVTAPPLTVPPLVAGRRTARADAA